MPESRFAESGGTRLHYLGWGWDGPARPGLLLVHGYRAHAHYWDALAPHFAGRYRVAAMDFAGMGDSGRRAAYTAQGFADDIAAVIGAAGLAPAIVVGHSFGGARALRAAQAYPALVARVVAVDSICRFADEPLPTPVARPSRLEPYPDYATARARWRLAPPQPCGNDALLDHVARHSLTETEGGWRWKFDPALPVAPREPDAAAVLEGISVPVDYVRGEHSSVVSEAQARRIVACLRHGRGPVTIPGAHHYPMLDQPAALAAALDALLA